MRQSHIIQIIFVALIILFSFLIGAAVDYHIRPARIERVFLSPEECWLELCTGTFCTEFPLVKCEALEQVCKMEYMNGSELIWKDIHGLDCYWNNETCHCVKT